MDLVCKLKVNTPNLRTHSLNQNSFLLRFSCVYLSVTITHCIADVKLERIAIKCDQVSVLIVFN